MAELNTGGFNMWFNGMRPPAPPRTTGKPLPKEWVQRFGASFGGGAPAAAGGAAPPVAPRPAPAGAPRPIRPPAPTPTSARAVAPGGGASSPPAGKPAAAATQPAAAPQQRPAAPDVFPGLSELSDTQKLLDDAGANGAWRGRAFLDAKDSMAGMAAVRQGLAERIAAQGVDLNKELRESGMTRMPSVAWLEQRLEQAKGARSSQALQDFNGAEAFQVGAAMDKPLVPMPEGVTQAATTGAAAERLDGAAAFQRGVGMERPLVKAPQITAFQAPQRPAPSQGRTLAQNAAATPVYTPPAQASQDADLSWEQSFHAELPSMRERVNSYLQSPDGLKRSFEMEPLTTPVDLRAQAMPALREDPTRAGMLAAHAAAGFEPPPDRGIAMAQLFGTRGNSLPGATTSLGFVDPRRLPPLRRVATPALWG